MRMSITIDENLLKEVMEVFNTKIKREAIEKGLREALRSIRRRKALEHCGSLNLEIDQEYLDTIRKMS
jgi:Arc/MetJ family transcription regulator